MRAVAEADHGGPEVLTVTDQPVPELTADGIRIRVERAGINRADVLQRTGNYKVPDGGSAIYGLEISGRVLEVGAEAPQHALSGDVLVPGARVCALMDSGGYQYPPQSTQTKNTSTSLRMEGSELLRNVYVKMEVSLVFVLIIIRLHRRRRRTQNIGSTASRVKQPGTRRTSYSTVSATPVCGSSRRLPVCNCSFIGVL